VFYIVEEESKLEKLLELSKDGLYVDVITTNNYYHPKLSKTVAVYLRPVHDTKGYIIPIDHEEGVNLSKSCVSAILTEIPLLYTLNKKDLLYHFNLQGAIDLSLLYSMTKYDRLEYSKEINNNLYSRYRTIDDINRIIPIAKLHESCEDTYNSVKHVIGFDIPKGFDFYNKTATNVFYLIEQPGIGVNYEDYIKLFTPRDPKYNTLNKSVLTSYNLYNATSRPTNAFNSVNFAAIPKSEEHRKSFRPKNNRFVELDFDGYHLRLLCNQINYKLTAESAHKQLAEFYYGTKDITDEQYIQAKQINFQAIYGKIPEEHKNLEIFIKVQEYIDTLWATYEKDGVVYNPQSGKPFTKALKEMHPAKLMNYMMQSLETSNNITILKEVLRYLDNKKSELVLYIYDALIIDLSDDDGEHIISELQSILECNSLYPVKFKYSNSLVL